MAVTINGDTGIDKIQPGTVEAVITVLYYI